ncbi:hypothetical protein [Streptomyces misionensis]|uniref:hypothetical protein n=1 Tax=Streptomyces misionensis TaxID=67331 RepID=UPI0033D9D6E2
MDQPFSQAECASLGQEVIERGVEDGVAVVVHGQDALVAEAAGRLGALGAVHGDHEAARQGGAARVQRREVRAGEAPGDLRQAVGEERVARDVEAQPYRAAAGTELQHAAHHLRQQVPQHGPPGVPTGQ